MEELLALQAALQSAQAVKASAKLSERNVVELINKLKALGLLEDDLLHTVTGKVSVDAVTSKGLCADVVVTLRLIASRQISESNCYEIYAETNYLHDPHTCVEYLTQKRLAQEVRDQVRLHGGRVSLVDLAADIGVDLAHCEKQAAQLVAEDPTVTLLQGDLITAGYWDGVAAEVEELLQEAGQVHGFMEAGQLYTPTYIARLKGQVSAKFLDIMRGALRATTVPTTVASILSALNSINVELDAGDALGTIANSSLSKSLLEGLVAEGAAQGTLRGDVSWVPAIFQQTQRESVKAFFEQNGYVGYEVLQKLAIPQPAKYMQSLYPDGTALGTVFVGSLLFSQLESAVEDAVSSGTWVDLSQLMPTAFSKSDTVQLIAACSSLQAAQKARSAHLMAGTCAVSDAFLNNCKQQLESEVRVLAEKAALARITNQSKAQSAGAASAGSAASGDPQEVTIVGGKEKGSKALPAPKQTQDEDDDDDVDWGKQKSKKKGGKAAKTKATPKVPKLVAVNAKEQTSSSNGFPTAIELVTILVGRQSTLDDGGAQELATEVVSHLQPAMASVWEGQMKAVLSTGDEARRKQQEALLRRLDEVYTELQLGAHGADVFEDDEATSAVIQRHLLRTLATEATDLLLRSQSAAFEHDASNNINTPLAPSERTTSARQMPKETVNSALAVVEALGSKEVAAFMEAFQQCAISCGIRLKQLDKKAERTFVHIHRKTFNAQLATEQSPPEALSLAVALLFAQASLLRVAHHVPFALVYGSILNAPGRALTAAIAKLQGDIPEESFELLQRFHSGVVQLLTEKDADACASLRQQLVDELQPLRNAVQAAGSHS
eukprot:jgi/Chlat1/6944/Chrsp52S09108